MDPFTPAINLLVVLVALSTATERVTNLLKLRRKELRTTPPAETPEERKENEKLREKRITELGLAVGVALAVLMKADLFAMLANLEAPWETLGWVQLRGEEMVRSAALSDVGQAVYAVGGSVLTGFSLMFGSKFWHDVLDIVLQTRERIRPRAVPTGEGDGA